ncbi:MAG: helix-turn-helix transcriptional regulator [Actinomycetota bacterium]|nr:helix-turn-helix transcriptional regulator [Actinomycetota bacterium]
MGTSANLSDARRLELASYLKARRASLQPHDVGLDPPRRRRNTPGLRREEVALLSGVGVTWYTWLEQGRPIATSEPVIDALARTLRLGREAHGHLRFLAGLPLPDLDPLPEGASPDLTRLLDTVLPAPACVLGPRFDFVAWNETFSHIWQPEALPEGRRNVMWLAFAEPGRRRSWVNWEQRSRILLAEFRAAAGQHAGDVGFAELITALGDASDEFRSWWSTYEVRQSFSGPLKVRMPGTGTIDFDVIELRVGTDSTLTLSVHVPTHPTDCRKLATMARGTLVVDALP